MAIRKKTKQKYMDALLLMQNEKLHFKNLNEISDFFHIGRPFGKALMDLGFLNKNDDGYYLVGKINQSTPSKISDLMNEKTNKTKNRTNLSTKNKRQMDKNHTIVLKQNRGYELSILWGLFKIKK